MNYSIIIYIIGMILEIEAVFMALPAITALIYQETSGVAFLITIALCLVIGLPLTRKKPTRKAFYTKEGFVTVALSWIVLSIIGAIPFVISRSIPNPVDALFETVSGFYYNRSQYSQRCGGTSSLYADVEKLHTLDRRNGCSGISSSPFCHLPAVII